jgi:diacylglycerol kinase family enzyme
MTFVLHNAAARHGRGLAGWRAVAGAGAVGAVELCPLDPGGAFRGAVSAALDRGERTFWAAGGDGTVGTLFDALAHDPHGPGLGALTLGAVGLGSSNDFHKPVARRVRGIPVRIDASWARRRDVGRVHWLDAHGEPHVRCFAVSASVGVVARANAAFNRRAGLVGALQKAGATDAAIVAAALATLATHRGIALRVATTSGVWETSVASASIGKTRHLAGLFTYDAAVAPDDGLLSLHLCDDAGRVRLLRTLAGLARGRFVGRPGTRSVASPFVTLDSAEPFDLEIDGEVVQARSAHFDLHPERPRVCA